MRLAARIRALFANSGARLDEEIRLHLEMLAAEYERRGLSPEEARLAARRDMGGITQIRELHRERRRPPFFDALAQDVRYALRQLRGSPLFTGAAILTLALGIGANTAIFQVLDAVVFRPLPVRQPERLVEIQLLRDGKPQRFSYPLFREMSARQEVFDGMLAVSEFPLHDAVLRGRGELKTIRGALASGDYFRVLGVGASLGRTFTAEDDRQSAGVAVISDAFWRTEFDAQPDAVGKTLQINRAIVTVIGVTPRGFFGETLGKYPDVWLPMGLQPQVMATDWLDAPYSSWLGVIGRLKPGVSPKQAQAPLDALYRQFAELNVRGPGRYTVELLPASRGVDALQQRFSHPLWILMATVGLVLLMACCNLANLLLGRAAARTHEIGVRLALGSGRGRLIRQLLTESLLLAIGGAALALPLASLGSRALLSLAAGPENWQLALDLGWPVAGFTAAIAISAAILFGLAPAVIASRVDLHAALQGGRRGQSAGRPRQVAGKTLVAAQISISLVLLSAAALLGRSLWNIRHQNFGFRSDGVLTASLPVEFNKAMMERNRRIRDPLYARLNAAPGVRAAALCSFGPMSSIQHTGGVSTPERPPQEADYTRIVHITPRYFDAMGIRIVAGRAVSEEDRGTSPRIAVISETAARTLFPGGNAVGRSISMARSFDAKNALRIVGVAHDVRFTPRDPYGFLVYVPQTQQPAPITEAILRTAGDPAAFTATLRTAILSVEPGLPIGEIRPLADIVESQLSQEKLLASLSACFGLLALALTCIGVYGVLAYAVKRRTQEIGIRLALGAGRGQVQAMLMRDLAMLVGISLTVGAAAVVALAPVIRTQLFGIAPRSYSTLIGAAAVLAGIAFLGGYLPARRAARLDPMTALREE